MGFSSGKSPILKRFLYRKFGGFHTKSVMLLGKRIGGPPLQLEKWPNLTKIGFFLPTRHVLSAAPPLRGPRGGSDPPKTLFFSKIDRNRAKMTKNRENRPPEAQIRPRSPKTAKKRRFLAEIEQFQARKGADLAKKRPNREKWVFCL